MFVRKIFGTYKDQELFMVRKDDMLTVLDLLDSLHMEYWVEGGWGADIVIGRQTREHRDLGIDFDAQFTDALLTLRNKQGYTVTTDLRPCRLELYR